jgi:phosphoglycerol geranylgeranyltransferase
MKLNFDHIIHKKKAKLAVLIDPDKYDPTLSLMIEKSSASFILVGGSKLSGGNIDQTVKSIKKQCQLPVILFPGDESQLTGKADGIFILSLISGRNPEYLIEKQVRAAQQIKKLKLKTFPVAYILVESGSVSETQRVTKTKPIEDESLIVRTAIAAEQLGFKAVYLEAGSGSKANVNSKIVKAVSKQIDIPLIVGGGIKSASAIKTILKAGANVVVVGNVLERNKNLIIEFSKVFD